MGFYLHCTYASAYIETIRKDFAVLMTHHILTLGLLLFSYIIRSVKHNMCHWTLQPRELSFRFQMIGLLLLSILDIGDILLELSKTVFYFKDCDNKKNEVAEALANVCFGIFTVQQWVELTCWKLWLLNYCCCSIICRLYWYPTKVIYSAMHISVLTFPNGPYYLLFNPMLWGLYAMQVCARLLLSFASMTWLFA